MLPLRILRHFALPLLLALAAPLGTHAQIITDLDLPEKLRIENDPEVENGVLLSWFGRDGFSYFLQTTTDLVAEPWQYLPVIETGYDDTIEYGFLLPSPRFFTRLVLHPETSFDPMSADFDGDGLANDLEFQNQTDPLHPDTDRDGLPDGWEIDRGLPARDNANALGDTDGDGAGDLLEYLRGTDPNTPELAAGVGILIAGLTHPQDSQIVHVGARGTAWVRDGSTYRLWSAGGLSAPLLDVPSPAPEPDNDPSTNELYTYTEGHWANRHGQAVHNSRAYDFILRTAETYPDYEETNRQLDSITTVASLGSAPTTLSLPTFIWSSMWDGNVYPQSYRSRIARVHGLDDDGFVWAELALTASTYDGGAGTAYILDYGIYKIDLDDPALPAQPTAYTPYGFLGVSRTGVALGQLVGQATETYSVNGVAVDYRPLFAGDTGVVWGWKTESVEIAPGAYSYESRYRAHFPDGSSVLAPADFNGSFAVAEATRFDPWNRLHGRHGAEQSVWDLAPDPGNPVGDPVWTRSAYQTLILGNGLYTNHRVPPGPWEPQGGIAWWWDAATETIMSAPSLFVSGRLSADADRDGAIHPPGPDDPDATYPGRPLRFIANDDDDNPGTTPEADYLNNVVDGADDLTDLFPLFLDIKQLLGVLPHTTAGITYKLKQADGGLNFAYSSLTRANAFNYLTDTASTYGPNADQAAASATTQQITAAGVDLAEFGPAFLDGIKNDDQGVILVELRGMTAEPLRLVVEKDGTEIAEVAVHIATGEAKFEALTNNAPLSDNKNMGTGAWMPGQGVRIFPDARNNTDTTSRNRVYAKVGLAGVTGNVTLRIIDVDDPSPSATLLDPDYQHLVDPNDATGERGDDNAGDLGGGRSAVFAVNNSAELTCSLESDGYARIDGQYPVINVSMRPGDNYRLVVAQAASDLAVLQVSNSAGTGYVAPNSSQPRGFKGLASEMLTVWRKIHVEQDTLEQVAMNGPERNLETGSIDSITSLGGGSFRLNLDVDLSGGQNRFQGGALNIEGQEFTVVSNDNDLLTGGDLVVTDNVAGSLAAWAMSGATGLPFILEDDDGLYLPEHAVLPLAASERLITPYVLGKYAPAYIEPDDNQPNPNRVISFKLNLKPPHPEARDLTDRSAFWVVRLVAAFQTTIQEDGDPDSEQRPITGEYGDGDACVFLESIREELKVPLSLNGPTLQNARTQFLLNRAANVAHEIGHAPNPGGDNNANDDHAEDGLMRAGIEAGAEQPFMSETIKRFRRTQKWSD